MLVDIDEGSVEINPDSTVNNGVPMEAPNLPRETANVFRKKWQQLKVQYELAETSRYSVLTY